MLRVSLPTDPAGRATTTASATPAARGPTNDSAHPGAANAARFIPHVFTRIAGGVEQVQIWSVALDRPDAVVEQLLALLSDAERVRASTQHTAASRRRFVVARAALRLILADATGIPVHSIAFCYGPDGKPSLEPSDTIAPLHFNVSHSRELALVAISDNRTIGIDLEWTEGTSPFESVAARYFSVAERRSLEGAAEGERRRLFYRIWVRKEAYLKARGDGISQWIYETDFSSTEANLDATLGVNTRASSMNARDQDRWVISDIAALPTGFVGSVAVARSGT